MSRKNLAFAWTLFLSTLMYTALAAALEPCRPHGLAERVGYAERAAAASTACEVVPALPART